MWSDVVLFITFGINNNCLLIIQFGFDVFYQYIGRGVMGAIAPKYSSIHSKLESSIQSRVWQTYVRRVERGDVIAIPKGVTFWWYNDGDDQHRVLCVEDTNLGVDQQYSVQVNQFCNLT
mgnify:CR=1 FL=1